MKTLPTRSLGPEEKRRLIFESARAVITERGFDAAKMDEIAARAGVGKGTLYNLFSSKEDLFLSLVLDSFERTRDLIDAEVDPIEDPWSRVEVAWRTLMLRVFPELVGQWNFNYQLWGFIARDREARERLFAQWRALYREREDHMTEAVEEGQAKGHFRADVDARTLSFLLLSIFDGILHRSMFDAERIEAGAVVQGIVDLMRSVLAPRPSAATTVPLPSGAG